MYLGVQPNLMERVVFETARNQLDFRSQYERQFADCHEHREPARRDQAFAELHDRWFRELGYRARFVNYAAAFPFINRLVERLMVTQASGPRDQTIELFGKPGQYTVVMSVAPAVLLDLPAFDYWARHELQHIDDMLNPAFEFDNSKQLRGTTDAGRNLARDRYAVLWAVSVDSRLEASGHLPQGMRQKRYGELCRAFGLVAEPTAAIARLWEQCESSPPSHPTLLQWSERGPPEIEPAGHGPTHGRSGQPCPLCGFPTFDWAAAMIADTELKRAILADFPAWNSEQGLCNRCEEIFRACVPAPVRAG